MSQTGLGYLILKKEKQYLITLDQKSFGCWLFQKKLNKINIKQQQNLFIKLKETAKYPDLKVVGLGLQIKQVFKYLGVVLVHGFGPLGQAEIRFMFNYCLQLWKREYTPGPIGPMEISNYGNPIKVPILQKNFG